MKTPKHLANILGMVHAAGLLVPMGRRLGQLDMLDAAVEVFDFLAAQNLNPDTLDAINGLCPDDMEYIIHTAVIAAYKQDQRTLRKQQKGG